jgi:hypothetical protein
MKRSLFFILISTISLFSNYSVDAQILFDGNTYALNAQNLNATSHRDLNTNFYTKSVSGGVGESLMRKDGYWYTIYQVYASDGGGSYLQKRTAFQHFTTDPPCQALWYSVGSLIWNLNQSPPSSSPNSTIQNYEITGNSCSSQNNSSEFSLIEPTFIQLPRLASPTQISSQSDMGKMIFNNSSQSVAYNNGLTWNNIWPNLYDYEVKYNQKIIFGETSSIYRPNSGSSLNIKSDNVDLVNSSGNSILSFSGGPLNNLPNMNIRKSYTSPFRTVSSSTTLTNNDHTIVYTGTGNQLFTLPSPAGFAGAEFIIVNHGSGSSILTISPAIKDGYNSFVSTLSDGYSFNIVSDGIFWRLITKSKF